jgi:hypothetical protein
LPRIPATCVSARALVHDKRGGAKLTGEAHGAERERERAHGATTRRLANRAREAEREEGRAGEGNRRRQLGLTRQRASERERERRVWGRLAPTGRVRLSRAAGKRARAAGPGGLVWVELAFSFFLNFLIAFPFPFSRVFNSNSNQVSNSN